MYASLSGMTDPFGSTAGVPTAGVPTAGVLTTAGAVGQPSYIPKSITNLFPAGFFVSSASFGSFLSLTYYGSLFILIVFLALIFVNFTMYPVFSFSPDDNGLIPVPVYSDKQTAFTKAPAPSDLSANFIDVPSCTYSLGMDIYLSGDFQAMTIPRVLLYRSTSSNGIKPASNLSSWTTGSSVSAGSTGAISAALMGTFPDSNLIIWLDPVKNDLYATVMTSVDGTAANANLETTPPIENVPIRKVFRLTVVFTQQFIELYINGNLERSMALMNLPVSASTSANFFPVISTIGGNIRIAHMAFWSRTLSARESRAYGMPIASEVFFNPVRSSS